MYKKEIVALIKGYNFVFSSWFDDMHQERVIGDWDRWSAIGGQFLAILSKKNIYKIEEKLD